MRDKDFLLWLAVRLENVYGEDPYTDFVTKLICIANRLPEEQTTSNMGRNLVEEELEYPKNYPPGWGKRKIEEKKKYLEEISNG